ncbi:MAG TPA: zinc-dependent alcohol dehydrogenase [Candidatus Polarisedimenticolia bacterium]|nr:zinc-dependent alcohol dehydrogenase [Candidatus Polarisedimenticolia bacterium]
MKAIVFQGIGDIRLDDVPDPRIQHPMDAVVRLTASAICGTDLHMVRGTLPGMKPGTILGHEGVGIVEELGGGVRNLKEGDRVVIPSTVGCGSCVYCRAGYYAQCDQANPAGPLAGTTFFGGPASAGSLPGLQAEKARVPYANVGLVKIPEEVSDDQAILLSDIFPTGWFAGRLADIKSGDTVAVFGCGPVGQFAIAGARLQGAGRVLAVDTIASRLDMARSQGAEVVDFNADDPVEAVRELTGGIGVDRAIDAVGVDAEPPTHGPAADKARARKEQFELELGEVAPETHPEGGNWEPGHGPSQAVTWAVEALAKAGTLSIIGVYPPAHRFFPLGMAMNKNLAVKMGNCNHRRYIPRLMEMVKAGAIDPASILTQREPLDSALEAYRAFDRRQEGWIKVEIKVGAPVREAPAGREKRRKARA